MLFGLRLFGSARGIAKFRDLTISGALGYGFLLVSLYQGIAFYNAPTAVFFRWAVQGVAFLALAGFTFQQLGRHVGTRATRKLFRSMPVSAALGILLIIAYATVAIFADVIAPYGQSEIFANSNVLPGGNPEMGGNPAHLLGTDQIGRDILSRLIFGAQNTVGIAFVTTLLAFFIGISLGFLAATIGGVLDQVLSRIVDMLMS
ncbi:MAG: ABC transporter permease, partial [SAR116 cluster bacterium MED-G06]